MKKFLILLPFLFCLGKNMVAQDTIAIKNASFEWGTPIANSIPPYWEICSRPSETPPDVHAAKTRHYQVNHAPRDGENFIGLVVRSNFTYESIYQKLQQPLQKGKTYQMKMYAAMSNTFESHDAVTMKKVLFNTPAIIRIWGVEKECETKELLYESPPIDHVEWKKLNITITPKMEHQTMLIEAFYDKMKDGEYNGNVLLDGLSEIVEQ